MRSHGPSPVEVLRGRIRRRCIAEGKEPSEFANNGPLLGADGKPPSIADVLRRLHRANSSR